MAMKHSNESGFALIVVLLALLLLTFLGLTLSNMTAVETQIALNQRWGEQARFNAEAGVDAGMRILKDADWATILPAARTTGGSATTWALGAGPAAPSAPNKSGKTKDQWNNALRQYELGLCDARSANVGYGAILDDGSVRAPYQNVNILLDGSKANPSIDGPQIQGGVTMWVRRPTIANDDGTYQDDVSNDHLVLTVQGTAPFTGNPTLNMRGGVATYLTEYTLSRTVGKSQAGCGTRAGQAGGAQEGANVGTCDPLAASGLSTALGTTVAELDSGAK